MARIFITGSSGGLGLMTGQILASQGHAVVLHARTQARAADHEKIQVSQAVHDDRG
jgi:NAD(P)-dependent dehydrogenase (short-subunit alcohol dehydrogenase family)